MVEYMVKWTIMTVWFLLFKLAAHGGETPLILHVGETWQVPTPSSSLCTSFEIKSITQDPSL
jgi:hypothetical protein